MLHNLYPMCCIEISSIPVLYPPLEMLSYDRVLHGDEEFFDSYIQNAVQSIDLCNFFHDKREPYCMCTLRLSYLQVCNISGRDKWMDNKGFINVQPDYLKWCECCTI